MAQEARHRAQVHRIQAEAEEILAGNLERAADEDEARRAGQGLTIAPDDDTLNTMNASPTSDSLRSRARLSKEAREHAFVVALGKRNETVAEAAEWLTEKLARKVPRSTVQSWYKPANDPGYRPIPADAEKAIRERYKVPRSAWHRVRE